MGQEKERHPSVKESAEDVSPPSVVSSPEKVVVCTVSMADEPKSLPKLRLAFGIVLVILVTISWTGSTQFTKTAYQNTTIFNSPFFLVYFSTSWMSICFPLYLLTQFLAIAFGFQDRATVTQNIKATTGVFGKAGFSFSSLACRTGFFILFWFIANYSYSRALSYISPSDVTAIFSSNLAFVYLLALFVLKDKIYAVKILSIVVSIVGIVLMALQDKDGFHGLGLIGIVLVVLASLAAAVYKVAFKRVIGDASFGQVSLFMTCIGLVNLLFVWPVMLGIVMSGTELVVWDDVPWDIICIAALLSLAFNFLINLGIAVTHPLFVSVGIFLGYPLNAVVDVVVRDHVMGTCEIAGSVLIVLGFAIMLLPDQTGACLAKTCCCRDFGSTESQTDFLNKDSIATSVEPIQL